jgi:S-DNA-T family DNA segregation ATPase FtsK/SpoIIIE
VTSDELIGSVAASYLRDHLAGDDAAGVARYLLDCLTADQTAAIAKAILADEHLSRLVEIKLPVHFVGNCGLPSDTLTTERTTYFRNAACEKSALLVANTGDDEEQSLRDLVSIGAPELLAQAELWVSIASGGLPVTEQHKHWWLKAIVSLLDVRQFALDRFAEYMLRIRQAVEDGHPVLSAIGVALPALHIPRDTGFFRSLNEKTAGQASKWKALYTQCVKKRACYLLKQTPAQVLLFEEDLQKTFDQVKDAIPQELHSTILVYIGANSGWNDQAAALAECEWELVKPLFDGLKREKFNLGKATLEFYEEREADLLTSEEKGYLARLRDNSRTEAQDEDEEFYRQHRSELKEQPSLKSKWDRFVFGTAVETEDFLQGIAACLRWLFDEDFTAAKRRLTIRSDRRTRKDLRELNNDAGLFFAQRYRGLKELFGKGVFWDMGELMHFQALDDQWRKASKPYVNRSTAKAALQLKFFLELEIETSVGTTDTRVKQLVWTYNPNSIACEFPADLSRLTQHPLVHSRVNREPTSGKTRFQSIDLRNVKTLYPAYGQDRGSFVPIYRKENDLCISWQADLAKAEEDGLVSKEVAATLLSLFQSFHDSYCKAIRGFAAAGLSDALLKQAEDYGALLDGVCADAKGDRNRARLLKPLLEIGSVGVDGGRVTVIVTPWQPLRLAAMAVKAIQVASLLRHLLTADEVLFGDPPLFFKQLEQELIHPYYPEIVLGWRTTRPELLSLTDYHLDYSLHEASVISNDGFDDTNESPTETSSLLVDLTKRFLSLYPHERANLSVVLYNCDSARLPYALVEKMAELHEDDEDMRCQIVLRHRDGVKLRELYERIIESSDADVDSFVTSEATKDFMARLRIGIMADQAPVSDPKDGPPADIVFLQDVIARHAGLDWYPEACVPVDSLSFIPARWSRRRPAAVDDMKSVAYLCCPVQTKQGWSFVAALTTFLKGDWDGPSGKRLLPARKLDFNDPVTASIFKEIHNLGDWVVNYDELLDRRQLLNQNVKVIRYKQCATQGRNILISSTAPLSLLRSMVFGRVRDLNLELTDADCRKLTEQFINDANDISGDIVLRAAKRGRNASELIGVVLSRYMIRHEIGTARRFGWYFLDDYAEWLGQREEQIADILALSPEQTPDGQLQLAAVIAESKYIDVANLAPKRKESQKQLRDTVRRINDALFGNPKRLDRELWLSRFSDLMLNGIQFPASSPIDLAAWRRAVREGQCSIYLRGYSHIFVSGPSDSDECSELVAVAEAENSYQEIFSRSRLRELVLAYWKGSNPGAIRTAIAGGQDIWSEQAYRKPSERIETIRRRKPPEESSSGDSSEPGGGPTPPSGPSGPPSPPATPMGTPPSSTRGPVQASDTKIIWAHPGLDKLFADYQGGSQDSVADADWLKQVENLAKGALQQFQLHSKLLASTLTPNAALLKFQGTANLTVEQVLRRRSEFLTTHKLNVISVRAEPGIVAIAIARQNRRVLHLPDVWKGWRPDCTVGNDSLLIALKEEDSSFLFVSPRSNAPHTLIAGSTGSGKSVLMQNIILAIACTNTPEQAKIVLIDPKLGVDYFAFEGLPHLQGGIIDTPDAAIKRLNDLVDEMNRRYSVLRENKVSNIFDLNRKSTPTERLPFLWIIHDEFAEWMMTPDYAEAVSNIVGRLGIKARAAGISLVFAAQRPDASVMPMQLRANLGNRLVLRVDGEGTSEIALGEKGAERLLGKGHLAAKLEGAPDVVFAQVPFVDSEFLSRVVDTLAKP